MKILIEESVLRQALETFTHCYAETDRRINERAKLLVELRTALDAAEKVEPVAWMYEHDGMVHDSMNPPLILMSRGGTKLREEPFTETALYAHPAIAKLGSDKGEK